MSTPRIIPLASAPDSREAWGRPASVVYGWSIAERLLVTNQWQISSRLRARVLRAFGATIGSGVILRPGLRVSFPWKLTIGDDCWIGEGVHLHNQDEITIGDNVAISQQTFITTGSHAYKRDMTLTTRPVVVDDGAWITTRVIVLGGTHIGTSAMVTPGSVVQGVVPPGSVVRGNPAQVIRDRFDDAPSTIDPNEGR